jgi:peptidoglycan/xylan/chitin deacetylase (PgdA/CDA1 family)
MKAVHALERAVLGCLSPAGQRSRLLILTYHRVPAVSDPLLPQEPDASEFAKHLDVLERYCEVLPLPEAARRLAAGTLPKRAACLTFDDGYANNLTVALPLLEKRGMRATVFIAVRAVEQGIMWNDLVIEALRKSAGSGLSPAAVLQALEDLKYLPLAERWNRALGLYQTAADSPPPRLMLTRDEVRQIGARGHDVGAHTMQHPILKELPAEEASREIHESHAWIRETTGVAPCSFAYPNGRPGRDYDRSHAQMVKAAGFQLAVSTAWGCAAIGSDVFQLPRCGAYGITSRWFPLRLARLYTARANPSPQ